MNSKARRTNTRSFVPGGILNPFKKDVPNGQGANETGKPKLSEINSNQQATNQNVSAPAVTNTSVPNSPIIPIKSVPQLPSPLKPPPPPPPMQPIVEPTPIPVVSKITTTPTTTPMEDFKPPPMMIDDQTDISELSELEAKKKKSYFFKHMLGAKKKQSIRVKERRIRQNQRLRKVLVPKNALMALNEVKGIKMSEFSLNVRSGGGFKAEVSVNNIQYEGDGYSKNVAKNSACEKALRDLIISKMLQKPKKEISEQNEEIQADTKSIASNDDVQMKDVEQDTIEEEDDVPMVNLASFALYKLFSEWENEGFEIPEFRPQHPSIDPKSPTPEKPKKPPAIRNDLPQHWEQIHPATLLCMMRPGIMYVELGLDGVPPNAIQRMGVAVDDENFIGIGRSKKIARRNTAVNACNKLFGTNFKIEE